MIRLAIPADVPGILHLECSCGSAAHWTEQQYRQVFDSEGAERLLLIAETALHSEPDGVTSPLATSEIIGFLVARHLAPEWELENLVVAPSVRRQGLGKRLLEALLASACATNSHSVFLEVRESNAAARSLYEKIGFEQTGSRKSYYKDPAEDAVLYRLGLE